MPKLIYRIFIKRISPAPTKLVYQVWELSSSTDIQVQQQAKMSTNQVALIIGASRGIGRQIAIDLAQHNYTGTSNQP